MKVAILGGSPVALEAALRFHAHGAAITWFNQEDELYSYQKLGNTDWSEATSDLGHKFLGKEFTHLTYSEWKATYFKPLEELLKKEGQRVKSYSVISVTKRYLAPGEEVSNKSRFHDLFRLIYEVDPQEFISEQRELDPALYQRLNEEVVNSLQTKIEMYEDVDLVIDCRRSYISNSLNVNGRALGEKRVSKEYLFYGLDALKKSQEDKSSLREVAIVGDDTVALETMLNFSEWLDDSRTRLFFVSHEETPFKKVLATAKEEVKKRVEAFFNKAEADFKEATETFMKKLREWQSLDDFVQVKIPRPVEPIPRLVFFMGHNASAIDQLIDNKRIFLTLETSDFRTSKMQPENNELDLKTIGVDCVLVSNGFRANEVNLDDVEIGYFKIGPMSLLTIDHWKKDLGELNDIESAIFKLFSPAESH